jgi:hypothetical protein
VKPNKQDQVFSKRNVQILAICFHHYKVKIIIINIIKKANGGTTKSRSDLIE